MAPKRDRRILSATLGHLLEATDLGASTIKRLSGAGIQDAEQFLALTAVQEVREHLVEYLDVSEGLERIIGAVRKLVPEPIATQMLTPDPYEYGLGALAPTAQIERENDELVPPAAVAAPAAIPPSVNLIPRMPPVRNQGPRGTCVAFTVTSIHDFATRLAGDAPNNFSEQHIYYETKLIDGAAGTCGTWLSKMATAISNRGQCLEATWPYNPNMPCNNHGNLPASARTSALQYRFQLTGYVAAASRNVQWIKEKLADAKPVGVSIPVWNSWYSSSYVRQTGIINSRIGGEPSLGGHAVCLVGYQDDDSSPGGGYFLVRNSWGTSWASSSTYGAGYGTIPYSYIANDNNEAFAPV